jgi:hypothetical protein
MLVFCLPHTCQLIASPDAERRCAVVRLLENLLSGTLLAKVTVIQSGQGLLSFKRVVLIKLNKPRFHHEDQHTGCGTLVTHSVLI